MTPEQREKVDAAVSILYGLFYRTGYTAVQDSITLLEEALEEEKE